LVSVNDRWDRFWFHPASPLGFVATRTVLAATSLWLLFSRPDLPEVLTWPAVLWRGVRPMTRVRFLIFDVPFAIEQTLWLFLFVSLFAALFGLAPRVACAVSSLLLYHFASLETILYQRLGPYFNGLTLPVLAFAALAVVRHPRLPDDASADARWPVALIQILLSFNYTFSAFAKVQSAGFGWVSGRNLHDGIIISLTSEPTPRLFARFLLEHDWICAAMITIAFITDSFFFLVPFSRRLRNILVPAAIFGHAGIAMSVGIVFLSTPYLLIYLDWDRFAERLKSWRATRRIRADSGAAVTST
jgi:hypothetical protein